MGLMGFMGLMGLMGLMRPMGKDDLLGSVAGHEGGDDTGDEDHHYDAIEHIVVDEVLTGSHLHTHTYHNHGDGSGGVGRGKAEHHVAVGLGQPEEQAGKIGGDGLAESTEESDEEYDPKDVGTFSQGTDVDEHADTDEEIWDEERIADELDAVHERGHVGDIPI